MSARAAVAIVSVAAADDDGDHDDHVEDNAAEINARGLMTTTSSYIFLVSTCWSPQTAEADAEKHDSPACDL